MSTDGGAAFRLEVLPEIEWAGAVAAWFAARLGDRPNLRVCLPTGDTPSPVYAELVAAEWRGEVSFASATVLLLDEWVGLPADDPARCDARLRDELLGQLAAPPVFVPIDVDGPDPEAAAAVARMRSWRVGWISRCSVWG